MARNYCPNAFHFTNGAVIKNCLFVCERDLLQNTPDLNTSGVLEDRGSTPDKERDDSLTDDSYQHKVFILK